MNNDSKPHKNDGTQSDHGEWAWLWMMRLMGKVTQLDYLAGPLAFLVS
jgi:hypothetical protein